MLPSIGVGGVVKVADGIKVANHLTLQGDYPELSEWTQCNHKGP